LNLKRAQRAIVLALLTAIVGGGVGAAGVQAATPSRRISLGISNRDNQSVAALDASTAAIGRKPAIWAVWSDWGGTDKAFPTTFMNVLKARAIVPMVNWQPVDPVDRYDCTKWSLDNTIRGDHDAYITQWATDAKNFGGRVILRFMHEANGYWFVWGLGRCQNTPAKFKTAWRHVWQIFRNVGATNVKFLWSIYGKNQISQIYPGNGYTDYVGFTGFNWGPPMSAWETMYNNFKGQVNALAALSSKGIIAAEMGAADLPSCATCDKAKYITDGYPAVYNAFPRLKAIVWFDIDMRFNQQPDWRLSSPPGALVAYKKIALDPRFQGKIS
jgi:mannan endo-1,4-beta-mannosidase